VFVLFAVCLQRLHRLSLSSQKKKKKKHFFFKRLNLKIYFCFIYVK